MLDERNPVIDDLLTKAAELRAEREDVFERQAANRDLLRNFRKLGMVSQEQADEIEGWYKTQERGPRKGKDAPAEGSEAPAEGSEAPAEGTPADAPTDAPAPDAAPEPEPSRGRRK